MKNKESWQLQLEREKAMQKNRKDIMGSENIKKALFQRYMLFFKFWQGGA